MDLSAACDEPVFVVVINDEEQFSIWPDDQEPPGGWHRAGFAGTRDSCLAHIESTWTDITPRSARIQPSGGV